MLLAAAARPQAAELAAEEGFSEPPKNALAAGRTGAPKMPQLSGEEESGSDTAGGVIGRPSGSDGHSKSSGSGSSGRTVLM